MPNLQSLLDDIPFESLPPGWTTLDLATFSRGKQLWDYQQTALRNALKGLWKYYGDGDYDYDSDYDSDCDYDREGEGRKRRFFKWYTDNDVPLAPDLPLGKRRDNALLLDPFYPLTRDAKGRGVAVPYQHFINRMGFWMATGSGKTLVIVKLLEALWTLMGRGLIPARDVMVLTHREDLLQQLRDHVRDFNAAGRVPYLRLRELRAYPDVKRGQPSLFGPQELTVFTYRSDNLSNEQKERIVDFRNYDNHGQWYVLLDEAHKGDKEDSKRQHIYSILSRDGFLFNFSATFTDARDVLTTACEFNLSSFIEGGYGKHISLLKQENRAFKNKEDFTNEEKQRIVLQSLLALAYASKARERLESAVAPGNAVVPTAPENAIAPGSAVVPTAPGSAAVPGAAGTAAIPIPGIPVYHRPLLLALVNSVNTDEADLKLFFRELARIGQGALTPQAFTAAKSTLKAELSAAPEYLYEPDVPFTLDPALFDSLTRTDVLRYVFNAESAGDIEVLARPSNTKELAFKLKSAAAPFALIKIGDIAGWLKSELAGYDVVAGFNDESFFAHLNEDRSVINLLMGSRSFYEGWDSNRPNVITFINIGTGADARKFILQSVGRGVRLEPLPGLRKRLRNLYAAGVVDTLTYQAARPFLPAIETLCIFGTNRAALAIIFEGLEQEKKTAEGQTLALDVNQAALSHHPVLIPVYRRLDGQLLIEQREPRKFEIQPAESALLREYVAYLGDERLLLARHNLTPQHIGLLSQTLDAPETYFNPHTARAFGSIDVLLPRLAQYFDIIPRAVEGFKPLEDEINHFRHIRVVFKDAQDLQNMREKITRVKNYTPPTASFEELARQVQAGEISPQELAARMNTYVSASPDETFDHNGQRLHIKHIAAHYYLPLLLSDDDKIVYINHIIRVPSEVRFINQLEAYLKTPDNLFRRYDWWLFSRTDETLDRVTLPYYDPTQNRVRDFHPDFVFWLVRGNDYTILFVDPKGMTIGDYQYKIDGYRALFRDDDDAYRIIPYGDYRVRVALAMFTADANLAPEAAREYWYDHPHSILSRLQI